jgi:hypothetical protein
MPIDSFLLTGDKNACGTAQLQVGTVSSSVLTAGAPDVLVWALDVWEARKAGDDMTQPRQTKEGCHAG